MEKLTIFINRLKKLGIETEYFSNFPWIYIDKINGQKVTEKYQADHGFTVAFLPVRVDHEFHFTDITEIFKLIRKYVERQSRKERKIFLKRVKEYTQHK